MTEATSLNFDLESFSACPIKLGGRTYADHPSTRVIGGAFALDNEPPSFWYADRPPPERYAAHIRRGGIVRGWNIGGFDWPMWRHMTALGWPAITLDQLRDTMAEAQRQGLPGALAQCGAALGLPDKWLKSRRGKALIRKCCTPTKKPPTAEEIKELIEVYCVQDVVAERAIAQRVSRLSDYELSIWRMTVGINQRGIRADVGLAADMVAVLGPAEAAANARMQELTNGIVDKITQVERIKNYITDQFTFDDAAYYELDLSKKSIANVLAFPLGTDPEILEIITLRQTWAKTSLAKLQAVIATGEALHDHIRFAGAHTLRWSTGGAIQLHNLPRSPQGFNQYGTIQAFRARDMSILPPIKTPKTEYTIPPPLAASYAIRGLLKPRPGKVFVRGDFASVEAIGVAWIAKCEKMLEGFRQRIDQYKKLAARIFRKAVEDVLDQERQIGKITFLGCGFMAGASTLAYQMPPDVPPELPQECVTVYREEYPEVRRFWYGFERAIIDVVNDDVPRKYSHIWIRTHKTPAGRWLLLGMPNGGWRWYLEPRLEKHETPWGMRWQVSVMGYKILGTGGKAWLRYTPHPGGWTENVVQSFCRDLAADAALDTDADPEFDLVHLVHDELLVEADAFGDYDEHAARLQAHMERPRVWLPGFPIRAECEILMHRYRK